ncbi:exported hypothetical protein [Luteimonas sp. 9C]|uniref:hypothetical protein n=1 Tax=Luteimonas sp. 9C TaxID=2653148 RepID=UPI0012EF6ADC|nr:hypothetical protein [Luteimonas sp. 9C]VXB17733.1 exported hypothetical protein [Luteimonas sp. 9C]
MNTRSRVAVSSLLVVLSASVFLTSAPVAAQDGNYIDAVTPYAHHQLHRYRGDEDDARGEEKTKRKYEASAQVSRELNRTLSQLLAGKTPRNDIAESANVQAVFDQHPGYRTMLARQIGQDAEDIERNLDRGILQSRLSELLDKRDYAANDPVEVLNAYLVTAWRVVHDDRQNAHDGSYRGLQRAMRNSEIVAPEASRQQVAEMFGIINMLTLAAWRNTREPDEREALRLGTLMLAKRMSGVDLQAVVLTDRGFARRN